MKLSNRINVDLIHAFSIPSVYGTVHVKLIYSQSVNCDQSLINEERLLQVLTINVILKLLLVHVLLEMTDRHVTYIYFDCLF